MVRCPLSNHYIVKVCGMRDAENIREVEATGIDWMGFIFWERSSRYVSEPPAYLPTTVRRVGVFVDAPFATIRQKIEEFSLDIIQLHGHESPAFCRDLRNALRDSHSIAIIKAFPIASHEDIDATKAFEEAVDYFLFDTRTPLPGGSGHQFDWSLLDAYTGRTPFLLSGGIAPNDAVRLHTFHHPRLLGIDLNSRFETAPAIKSIPLLTSFLKALETL